LALFDLDENLFFGRRKKAVRSLRCVGPAASWLAAVHSCIGETKADATSEPESLTENHDRGRVAGA
jgi:hypothetical protein